jgi:fatty acid desaturase
MLNETATSRPGSTRAVGAIPEPTESELREVAITRVKKKEEFRSHFFVYVVVNALLWTIWIVGGAAGGWAFPWPVFPTVFWGLFVLGHFYDVYRRHPLREDRVQEEIEELRAASLGHPIDTYRLEDDDRY